MEKPIVIDFETLNGLTTCFINRLKIFDEIFIKNNSIEQFKNDDFHQLVIDINNFCLEIKLVGYHFTNAIDKDILENGIILRTGEEIRKDFIRRHFHLFTKSEKKQILMKWEERFDKEEACLRDNIIFFDFTTNALKNGGAEDLLDYYGGEQVFLPLIEIPQIREKLKNIGTPMILKCILKASDIHTYSTLPWGKLTVSSYHTLKNHKACLLEPSAYQEIGVSPDNIEIIKYDKHYWR